MVIISGIIMILVGVFSLIAQACLEGENINAYPVSYRMKICWLDDIFETAGTIIVLIGIGLILSHCLTKVLKNKRDNHIRMLHFQNKHLCPKCSTELSNEMMFCKNCGLKQNAELICNPIRKCRACGNILGDDSLFCFNCGTQCEADANSGSTAEKGRAFNAFILVASLLPVFILVVNLLMSMYLYDGDEWNFNTAAAVRSIDYILTQSVFLSVANILCSSVIPACIGVSVILWFVNRKIINPTCITYKSVIFPVAMLLYRIVTAVFPLEAMALRAFGHDVENSYGIVGNIMSISNFGTLLYWSCIVLYMTAVSRKFSFTLPKFLMIMAGLAVYHVFAAFCVIPIARKMGYPMDMDAMVIVPDITVWYAINSFLGALYMLMLGFFACNGKIKLPGMIVTSVTQCFLGNLLFLVSVSYFGTVNIIFGSKSISYLVSMAIMCLIATINTKRKKPKLKLTDVQM